MFLETVFVECPVFATIVDTQGRRSGYAPPPRGAARRGRDPGPRPHHAGRAGGHAAMAVLAAANAAAPLTLRLTAYAGGPMTITIVRPAQGRAWVYRNVNVATGDSATLTYAPSATTPPALQFAGGRSVAGVIEPIGLTGASPHDVVTGGGRQVTIGGIAFAGGGLLRPGRPYASADGAATDVAVLNGFDAHGDRARWRRRGRRRHRRHEPGRRGDDAHRRPRLLPGAALLRGRRHQRLLRQRGWPC